MNIAISGGHGFLGQCLVRHFSKPANTISLLPRTRVLAHDEQSMTQLVQSLEGVDVLINLSGKSVDCRYNEKNKNLIYASRLDTTRNLGTAVSRCQRPPTLWLNASSATIYRHSLDKEMDEDGGEIGTGFSVDVCQKWEAIFNSFNLPATRRIALRTAIVLGRRQGAMIPLMRLARAGLGGKMGKGNQYFSWLHEDDFVGIVEFLIRSKQMTGVLNLCSPNPVTNDHFMRTLRQAVGVRIGIPSPAWLLEIGAFFIRTETELVLKSRRVIPARLLQAGFTFQYDKIENAFANLLSK